MNNALLIQSATEIRAIVAAVLYRTSRDLTKLLRETKEDLRARFMLNLEQIAEVPDVLSRESDLYEKHIGSKKFNHIIRLYADQRHRQSEKNAMLSEVGMKIIRRVIKTRLWEHLRGRHRAIKRHQAELELAANANVNDSESENIVEQSQLQLDETSESDDDGKAASMVLRNKKIVDNNNQGAQTPKKRTPTPEMQVVLIKDAAKASTFKFNVLDIEGLFLVPSDKTFIPKPDKSSSRASIISSLNTLGTMNISGAAMKSVLLRSSTNRVKLMFDEDENEHSLSFDAPYVDRNVRLYTLLIDLSVRSDTIVSPQVAQHRFHVFLALLAYLTFKISPTSTANALWSLGIKKDPKSAKEASDLMIALPWDKIKTKCYTALLRLVVTYDFYRNEAITINSELSDRLSKYQPSLNDYERSIFALGLNLLAPVAYRNESFPNTLELYDSLAWKVNLNAVEDTNVAILYNEYLVRLYNL